MTIVSKNLTSKVIKLFQNEGETLAKLRTTQDMAINAVLDAMTLACDKPKAEFMKGNAKTNDARREVKEMFDAIISPTCAKSSANQYQSAFWIAFEKGVAFQRDLVNKKSDAKKDATAKAESTAKAGKVETTDMAALTLTLQKALHQCKLLNQSILKGALLDAIVESIPDFVEVAK